MLLSPLESTGGEQYSLGTSQFNHTKFISFQQCKALQKPDFFGSRLASPASYLQPRPLQTFPPSKLTSLFKSLLWPFMLKSSYLGQGLWFKAFSLSKLFSQQALSTKEAQSTWPGDEDQGYSDIRGVHTGLYFLLHVFPSLLFVCLD